MSIFDLLKKKAPKQEPINTGKTFRNDIEKSMYENNTMGYKDTKDHLDYQNSLLNKVNQAQERYKQDGNIDAVIKELEYAFITANPPCNSSQNLDLANYYIKAGQNNKAWGYLNMLESKLLAPTEKIRLLQARILKKEKKWADAIEMYMLGYLAKSKWNNTFQKEMFQKDIQSSANKLGWDNTKIEQLSLMIEKQVKQKNYDGSALVKEFRKYYQSITHTD